MILGGILIRVGVRHPLFFRGVIILRSLLVGVVLFVNYGSWFFYSLVLVILGGMIVIILYICVIRGGGKLGGEVKISLLVLGVLGIWGLNGAIRGGERRVGVIFEGVSWGIVEFLMGYLLIVLFLVVKLSLGFKGSLVKFI